jgi:predicted deacylase
MFDVDTTLYGKQVAGQVARDQHRLSNLLSTVTFDCKYSRTLTFEMAGQLQTAEVQAVAAADERMTAFLKEHGGVASQNRTII